MSRYTSKHTGKKIDDTIDNVSNPNLLDNWYFGNPVNQRGNTVYGHTPQYCIDRWKINNDYAFVDVNDGYITIRGNDINGYGGIIQHLEDSLKADLIGKNLTLSVLMKPYTALNLAGIDVCEGADSAFGLYSVTFTGTINDYVVLKAKIPVTPGEPIADIIAAKLELGSQQTLAHQENGNWVLNEIPDYGEQLARCQRYQVDIPSGGNYIGRTASDTLAVFEIPTPVTMRATPSISSVGQKFPAVCNGQTYMLTVSGIDVLLPQGVRLVCAGTNLPVNQPIVLYDLYGILNANL